MKKLDWILGSFMVMSGLLVAGISLGASTVTVSVTARNVSVSVTSGTVEFGSLGVNESTTTIALAQSQTVTNIGNTTINLNIACGTSTNWGLGANPGSEQFAMDFSKNNGADWTAFTVADQYDSYATGVTASATSTLDLQLYMPTATANYTAQSIQLVVQASA